MSQYFIPLYSDLLFQAHSKQVQIICKVRISLEFLSYLKKKNRESFVFLGVTFLYILAIHFFVAW